MDSKKCLHVHVFMYLSVVKFEITKHILKPFCAIASISCPIHCIKHLTIHMHFSSRASVFSEAFWMNHTNWICSSSIQDSVNHPYQFSIFFSVYRNCEQISTLVGGRYTLTHSVASEKELLSDCSLCNHGQKDQQNGGWSYCLQSNSSATVKRRSASHSAYRSEITQE